MQHNKQHTFWTFIHEALLHEDPCILLVVAESSGSSPGRQGFKMAVTEREMIGSIGGGIMEMKLVEHARSLLHRPSRDPLVKKQIQRKVVLLKCVQVFAVINHFNIKIQLGGKF